MEENNFEKDIRRELEGMKILPSDKAWINVEKRISQKKDRRSFVFLFLLLLLFISVGGYFFLNSRHNKNSDGIVLNKTHINKQDLAPVSNYNDTDASSGLPTPVNKKHDSVKMETAISPVKQSVRNNSQHLQPVEDLNELVESEKEGKPVQPEVEIETSKPLENAGNNEIDPSLVEGESQVVVQLSEVKTEKTDSTSNPDTMLRNRISPEVKKEIIVDAKKQKWNWGFTFSAGNAYVRNSLFDVFGEEKSAAPANQYDPGSSTGGQRPDLVPSMPQHSLGFTAGIVAKKEFSLRTKFSLGLRYKYYSTTNKVGNPVRNLSQYYYLNTGNKKVYRNNFHFVELPVQVEVRLTRQNKLPVHWNAGVHLAQLIASNALQFDSGKYFRNNALFNKTQIGFSTGFDVTLFSKQKFPVNIGPTIYYSASKIANNGLYGGTHFSFIGLRAEILLLKKK